MIQWLREGRNEHLVSRNGLLDIKVEYQTQEHFGHYTGTSQISEAFTVNGQSIDSAKYKVLLATRARLLDLLRDVEEVLQDYPETEKLGDSLRTFRSQRESLELLS